MTRVLVVSFSFSASDPRVMRQIRALGRDCDVLVVGLGVSPLGQVGFVSLGKSSGSFWVRASRLGLLALRLHSLYYWRANPLVRRLVRQLSGLAVDVVVANDLETVPAVRKVFPHAKVVLDAHEYSPDEHTSRSFRGILFNPYGRWLLEVSRSKVDRLTTVSEGLGLLYRQSGFECPIAVIPNVCDRRNLAVRPTNAARIRMVHHGFAVPGRGLELLVEVANCLEETHELHFFLRPSGNRYMDSLRKLRTGTNVQFHDPAPNATLVNTLNQYDLGVYLLPPTCQNNLHAMPNKIFEFVQARLALVVGPSRDMSIFVRENRLGVVSESWTTDSFVRAVQSLSRERIDALKANSSVAAEAFCSENFLNEVRRSVTFEN